MKKTTLFILQSVMAGLAIAFVTLFFMGSFNNKSTVVEFKSSTGQKNSSVQSDNTITTLKTGFSQAVKNAAPAVVYIYTARIITEQPHPFLRDRIFREFFGSDDNKPQRRLETGLGSGVVISPQGYILTNYHVIQDADRIQIQLADGRGGIAHIVGADPETDLAVLQIALDHLPVIHIGQSKDMNVGDVVLAIGNPFGVGQTVTMGIISATGRHEIGITTFENFIQTDAAINPGNSGGALVNPQGDLIGINTAVFGSMGDNAPSAQGIGFAIPIALAKNIMQQIISQGYVTRGWLGIEVQDINPRLAYALDIAFDEGALIRRVQPGGPADKTGLKSGDILISIAGKKINSARDALNHIVQTQPNKTIELKMWRGGKILSLPITPNQRPQPESL